MLTACIRRFMPHLGIFMLCLLWQSPFCRYEAAAAAVSSDASLSAIIEKMKQEPRGPFRRIRWFCNDGSNLPTGEYVCSTHGGGYQHGEWSRQTLALRDQGYLIANVLAGLDPAGFTGPSAQLEQLRQILLERYLVAADDGWVFRRARFYRGAIQSEDEQVAASRILRALLTDPEWRRPERFLLLREAVRLLLPSGALQLTTSVRQAASSLEEKDPGFAALRIKIHGLPDSGDAERVRAYARDSGLASLQPVYAGFADLLDAFYAPHTAEDQLQQLAKDTSSRDIKARIKDASAMLAAGGDEVEVMASLADRMLAWRILLQKKSSDSPEDRLRLFQASLMLEREVFVRANRLPLLFPQAGRAQRLGWLRHLEKALAGAGLLSQRQLDAFLEECGHLTTAGLHPSAGEYYASLRYLGRTPQWAQRSLEFHYAATVGRWGELTPLAAHFVPDRLRASPVLSFTRILDHLMADASRMTGISHHIFGQELASSLRALNPGLSRGVLLMPPVQGVPFRPDGIYILPSTTEDLPPVAGIITSGEGSSLSHVQLLARNMGIPNLVADDALLQVLGRHVGDRVVLAVSRRGAVSIEADGPQWDEVFGMEAGLNVPIDANLERLDLHDHALHALRRIHADDSGRIVGPKAANLGELGSHYPELVPPGLVIPFGVFRRHLDKPLFAGGPSVFDWMSAEYARLKGVPDQADRRRQTRLFLARLREWILATDPGEEFRQQLRFGFGRIFGSGQPVGVFVRSDTNVEDLPGFSGAGLNLTLSNVVGIKSIVNAVKLVWASPFSERAFAWRQAHMQHPEHVYPAVLLLQSVNSEKSGVMVTADVESGDRRWLTIAASEGVGGAVEGQAAEEVVVERASGRVRLLAQATAPWRVHLLAAGGSEKVAASGREQLLSDAEIRQLRDLAADVERDFPLPMDETGKMMAADIEFGFAGGKLALFQLRPFVESRRARQSEVLRAMDRQWPLFFDHGIDLAGVPAVEGGGP
ncbi:phosphoenolpyruvate synthase [Mariprofundus erugo]|uniref:PEP/pyruvate-binding domain-containing protein n=1 Tax=Mariprofundus erugo TaxID=2528639 RepID=UPI0010FD5463|nr:PEP/pyruvate-binding domain-containing protein [Mariprofundus erugo]TLS75338.1 phosphoenolpyruvate synthase [Mariprofundus erugo]